MDREANGLVIQYSWLWLCAAICMQKQANSSLIAAAGGWWFRFVLFGGCKLSARCAMGHGQTVANKQCGTLYYYYVYWLRHLACIKIMSHTQQLCGVYWWHTGTCCGDTLPAWLRWVRSTSTPIYNCTATVVRARSLRPQTHEITTNYLKQCRIQVRARESPPV